MEFGFSWVGVIFLLMLFVPNIIWSRNRPRECDELSHAEHPALLAFERAGEVAASVTVVIFVCPQGFAMPWLLWLLASLLLMLLYEAAWIRYFKSGSELMAMYAPLGFIPVPLASLPVFALLLLGIWHLSPFTVVAAAVLGIGHIGIHLSHLHQIQRCTQEGAQ